MKYSAYAVATIHGNDASNVTNKVYPQTNPPAGAQSPEPEMSISPRVHGIPM